MEAHWLRCSHQGSLQLGAHLPTTHALVRGACLLAQNCMIVHSDNAGCEMLAEME
jgi:hypothetical protein